MNKHLLGGAAAAAIFAAGAALAQASPPAKAPVAPVAKTETRADVQARVAKLFVDLRKPRADFSRASIPLNRIQVRTSSFPETTGGRWSGVCAHDVLARCLHREAHRSDILRKFLPRTDF